jgi:hypothetical protein
MATEPNAALLDGTTPTIQLAGRAWPVPMLAPRQNRVVVPGIGRWARSGDPVGTTEQFDEAIVVVHAALTRAHPSLTREEFEDWPVSARELMAALPVIAQQTGLFVPGEAGASGEG